MKRLFLLVCLILPLALFAQKPEASAQDTPRIELTLERADGSRWVHVDPGLVLQKNDRIRFRFRSNFEGFLYVMNYGTSGTYSLLFPREETGRQNRIKPGIEYRVPATETVFRIDGPPGHDVVYWMVTPLALESGDLKYAPPPLPRDKKPATTLLPRCDDSLMRARGLCIDSSAGPRNANPDQLPENLSGVHGVTSRELIIMRQQDNSLISSPVPLQGPVVYEFRLAHR